jgi:hypothetical protein
MAFQLRCAIVTASDSGIGRVTAVALAGARMDPRAERRPGVPLGHPGDAREIAAVIAFLTSAQASYVAGASWPIDDGMLQMGPQAGSPIATDDWQTV